ncbi:TetR/AcrR family transcriptional regulator [Niveispirillum sp. KHB5.9]|uniref:TetR/AcrR family transcriptional regulator n=1 Tax=Niveispirillum sp. KHB5.9 TaxID=3400269 RepID=UPI003A8679EB
MSLPDASARYHSPLREKQKDDTRQTLLAVAGRVVADAGLEGLSFAALAREAGVQERTAYRHFSNKDALLSALWEWVNRQADIPGFARTREELLSMPPVAYAGFDRQEGLMRALLSSPQGREFRLRVNDERQATLKGVLSDLLPHLSAEEGRNLLASIQLLYSATAWMTMKDYWGLDGKAAGDASVWAIKALLDTAARTIEGRRQTQETRD